MVVSVLPEVSIEIALLRPCSDRVGLELFVKLSNGECHVFELGILATCLWAEQATAAVGEYTRRVAMRGDSS